MRAGSDDSKEADGQEGEDQDHEGKWSRADTWLGILFLLTMLGIGATGLLTLMHAAGRLH